VMGVLTNRRVTTILLTLAVVVIIALNLYLLEQVFVGG
jgi:Mn2+/Fe2+ NRAMP family transporter